MKIRTRILIPSLIAVSMMLLLGVVSTFGLRFAQRALDDVATRNMQHTALLTASRGELLLTNIGGYRLLAMIGSFDETRIGKETAVILSHADGAIQLLNKMRARGDIQETEKQLEALQEQIEEKLSDVASLIFTAQILMLKDQSFLDAIVKAIGEGRNPPDAVRKVASQYATMFDALPNQYLRDKKHDVLEFYICNSTTLFYKMPVLHRHMLVFLSS